MGKQGLSGPRCEHSLVVLCNPKRSRPFDKRSSLEPHTKEESLAEAQMINVTAGKAPSAPLLPFTVHAK